ncbi:hypothetical protein BJF78_04055 [Pseudonocardia sp. CNS-139]|nr:hypothetical protein BJF78_04055 [Pseudonocardia sp. CNS-139]
MQPHAARVGDGRRLVEDLQHPLGARAQRGERAGHPGRGGDGAERGDHQRDRGGAAGEVELAAGHERDHGDEHGDGGRGDEPVGEGVLRPGGAGVGQPVPEQPARPARDPAVPAVEAAEDEQLAQALHAVDDVGVDRAELGAQRGAALPAAAGGVQRPDGHGQHPDGPDDREDRVDHGQRDRAADAGDHRDDRPDAEVREETFERLDVAHRDGREIAGAAPRDRARGAAREPVEDLQAQLGLGAEGERVPELGERPVPHRGAEHREDDHGRGRDQPVGRRAGGGRGDQPAAGRGGDDREPLLGDGATSAASRAGRPARTRRTTASSGPYGRRARAARAASRSVEARAVVLIGSSPS